MRADRRARAPRGRRPGGAPRGFPPRRSRARRRSRPGARRGTRGPRATPAPALAPRALRAAGAAVELAQVGDHPRGVDRRRGALAQAMRSRRSAWARQWAPPPPSVNISRSGSRTSSPSERSCSLSALGAAGGDHPVVAERDRVDPEPEGVLDRRPRGSRTRRPAARPRGRLDAASTQTAASFGARIETSTSMWTKWAGIGSTRTSQPSSSNQPPSCAGRRLLGGALLAVADQDAPGLDDDHVAALERAGGDHARGSGSRCRW